MGQSPATEILLLSLALVLATTWEEPRLFKTKILARDEKTCLPTWCFPKVFSLQWITCATSATLPLLFLRPGSYRWDRCQVCGTIWTPVLWHHCTSLNDRMALVRKSQFSPIDEGLLKDFQHRLTLMVEWTATGSMITLLFHQHNNN